MTSMREALSQREAELAAMRMEMDAIRADLAARIAAWSARRTAQFAHHKPKKGRGKKRKVTSLPDNLPSMVDDEAGFRAACGLLAAGLEAERRQLEMRAREAVEVSEQAQQDAIDARNLVGELRARLRGALAKTAAPETEPPPEPPSSACPY